MNFDFDSVYNSDPANSPIVNHKREILYAIAKFPILIISTDVQFAISMLPIWLAESGWAEQQTILVAKPRKSAAISLSRHLTLFGGFAVGSDLSLHVDSDYRVSRESKIKVVDENILMREIYLDPIMNEYSAILLTDYHEGSILSDLLISLLCRIISRRPKLRFIIHSNSLSLSVIEKFLTSIFPSSPSVNNNASSSSSESNQNNPIPRPFHSLRYSSPLHPISLFHVLNPVSDIISASVQNILFILRSQNSSNLPGSVLVFLPGRDEINAVKQLLSDIPSDSFGPTGRPRVVSLFAGQPHQLFADSLELISDSNASPLLILSDSTIEFSIQIPNVSYVIDSGLICLKLNSALFSAAAFDSFDRTMTAPASLLSIMHRTRFAARNSSGIVFRLFPHSVLKQINQFPMPEIQRSSLELIILCLKSLGISNIVSFPFPHPLSHSLLISSFHNLISMKFIDSTTGDLSSPFGYLSLKFLFFLFSRNLSYVRLLFSSLLENEFKKVSPFIINLLSILVAISQSNHTSLWNFHSNPKQIQKPKFIKFIAAEGDFLTYLNIFHQFYSQFCPKQRNSTYRLHRFDTARGKSFCEEFGFNFKLLQRAVEIRKQIYSACRESGFRVNNFMDSNSREKSRSHGKRKNRNFDSSGDELENDERESENADTESIGCAALSDLPALQIPLERCILSGFFHHAARIQPSGLYKTINGTEEFDIHPNSVLSILQSNRPKPDWIVFDSSVPSGRDGQLFVSPVMNLTQLNWLAEVAPDYFTVKLGYRTIIEADQNKNSNKNNIPAIKHRVLF